MASPGVIATFEERLAAEWSFCPIIPENAQGDTPIDGSAFLFVHYPFVTREQVTFGVPGANVFREDGAARMVLNIERGSGLDQARAWIEDLVAIFIGRDIGGVIIRGVDGPVTDDRNEDGNYFSLAVAFSYQTDFTA
jgi:hypothetical protein